MNWHSQSQPHSQPQQRFQHLVQTQAATSTLVSSDQRLAREWKTVRAMIRIYCRDHHKPASTGCPECEDLTRYVNQRLDRCHFGADKPTCAKCPVHCYRSERREQIKTVMRYAGPRMMWEHPWLSLRHLLDGWFQRPRATSKPARVKS